MEFKRVCRDDPEYERVVFAEVLVPGVPNSYADYWTEKGIREAAYMFMREGYGIDLEHDQVDRSGPLYVIESFIAREGDPDFIKGSWVVGMKIEDDALWQDVLDNKINGYSFEALVEFTEATLTFEDDGTRTGITEPAADGHTHTFMAVVDFSGNVLSGGTDVVDGHSHDITSHTTTGSSAGHKHRYNIVQGKDAK